MTGLWRPFREASAAGLTQGVYDTKALPIYKYLHSAGHPRYAIGDNFFQAAFGGSFLNHQWLIAATTPVFLNAVNDGGANDLHAVVDANGMPNNYPFYTSPLGTAVKDTALTPSCRPAAGRPATPANVQCGDFAVNTIQPWYQPYSPGTADAKRRRAGAAHHGGPRFPPAVRRAEHTLPPCASSSSRRCIPGPTRPTSAPSSRRSSVSSKREDTRSSLPSSTRVPVGSSAI